MRLSSGTICADRATGLIIPLPALDYSLLSLVVSMEVTVVPFLNTLQTSKQNSGMCFRIVY